MSRPITTLTTDFGQADAYVGTMKGVILGICPETALVDLAHDIHPQAVQQAAYVLSTAAPYFPPGTVHLVVVDPGVGSERRPIVVQTERYTYVAPDNGVLGLALRQDRPGLAVHLTELPYRLSQVSATFHGRDIFAPAAAHLARGIDPREMGAQIPLSDLVTLPTLQPQQNSAGIWSGQILHIDRFGNLITNLLPPSDLQLATSNSCVIAAGRHIAGLSRTFSDVAPGELVAYVGSSGYLEIAEREGNAAKRLGMEVGDQIQVKGLP
jgi:S-adenosylmethionine hydrolase